MWFIGVEVEQETSAPPPRKNPGSAPVCEPNNTWTAFMMKYQWIRTINTGFGDLSFPPPLSFFGSCFISRAAKTENPVPRSFFAPKPDGNACYAGYVLGDFANWLGNEAAYVAGAWRPWKEYGQGALYPPQKLLKIKQHLLQEHSKHIYLKCSLRNISLPPTAQSESIGDYQTIVLKRENLFFAIDQVD